MGGFLDGLVQFGGMFFNQMRFRELLNLEREASVQQISMLVRRSSPKELDTYERFFLRQLTMLNDEPTLQVRAAELYAYLKLEEYLRYQEFRGFWDEKSVD